MGETAGKMKQFATWFTHGVPGGAKLRAAIYHARTGAEVLAQVEQFFAARREEGPTAGEGDQDEEPAAGISRGRAGLRLRTED
jgi:tRNA-dihydrouridine synthase B